MDRSDARKRKAELAGDAAGGTPEACVHCGLGRSRHGADSGACLKAGYYGNHWEPEDTPAPVQPPAPDPDETVVTRGDERLLGNPPVGHTERAERLLDAMFPTVEVRPHCGQCGKRYEERACGPTHALIAHERVNATPTPVPPVTAHSAPCAVGLVPGHQPPCRCPVPPITTGGTDEAEGLAKDGLSDAETSTLARVLATESPGHLGPWIAAVESILAARAAALRADIARDLVERLNKANRQIEELAASTTSVGSIGEHVRLRGKADGVRLARSYVEEMLR